MNKNWVTIVFCSHDKPIHCRETITSIQTQTLPHWRCIIHDSGILYDQGYFDDLADNRIQVLRSPETEEMRQKINMASWLFNRTKVETEWVIFLCDDDLLYPQTVENYYQYAKAHRHVQAMYGHGRFTGPGQPFAYSKADCIRGSCVGAGAPLDCRVDGGQVCVKSSLLDNHKWPEELEHRGHADGIWLESVGKEVPFEPVDALVLWNRKIPNLSLSIKEINP